MKVAVWGISLILAIVWTAGIAITVEVVRWSIGALAAGGVGGLTEAVARIPVADWLAPFIDIFGGREMLSAVASWLQSASTFLPLASQSLGWLVPALWVVWALGLGVLLIVTVLVSRLLRG